MKASVLFSLALCAGGLGGVKASALPPGVARYPDTPQTKPQPLPDISEVKLERTRCLTSCPAYTVTIQADGSFSYTGLYNVEHMGEHTGQVEVGQLRQVFRYIDEIGFTELQKSYLSPYLDNATVTTSVVQNGVQKTVMNYANGGPATLWALAKLIDMLLENATWDAGGQR